MTLDEAIGKNLKKEIQLDYFDLGNEVKGGLMGTYIIKSVNIATRFHGYKPHKDHQ